MKHFEARLVKATLTIVENVILSPFKDTFSDFPWVSSYQASVICYRALQSDLRLISFSYLRPSIDPHCAALHLANLTQQTQLPRGSGNSFLVASIT